MYLQYSRIALENQLVLVQAKTCTKRQIRNRTNSSRIYRQQTLQPKERASNKLHVAVEIKDALEENTSQTTHSSLHPERQNKLLRH